MINIHCQWKTLAFLHVRTQCAWSARRSRSLRRRLCSHLHSSLFHTPFPWLGSTVWGTLKSACPNVEEPANPYGFPPTWLVFFGIKWGANLLDPNGRHQSFQLSPWGDQDAYGVYGGGVVSQVFSSRILPWNSGEASKLMASIKMTPQVSEKPQAPGPRKA